MAKLFGTAILKKEGSCLCFETDSFYWVKVKILSFEAQSATNS